MTLGLDLRNHTCTYQVIATVQWFFFLMLGESELHAWNCAFHDANTQDRRKLDKPMTNQPCWQSAATIRRESDLSFVAIQGAHSLLNGGALHSAAVHAEHWKGQTEAPFTVTFTGTLNPKKKHWLLTDICSVLASQIPCLCAGIVISLNTGELSCAPGLLCKGSRRQDI